MNRYLFLYLLAYFIFSLKHVISIICCTNFNCTETKNCTRETFHCFLSGRLKSNKSVSEYIYTDDINLTYLDCWMWSHEANLCPSETGGCYSAHNNSNFNTFCCAGDFCNNPKNIKCELRNQNITTPKNELAPQNEKPNYNNETSDSNYVIIFIIIGIFTVLILCLIIFLRDKLGKINIFKHHQFSKRETTYNGLSQASEHATCLSKVTSENFSLNQQQSFSDEVLKASNYFEKCEKKCLGKFGEIWIGKSIGIEDQSVAIKIFRPRDEASWETEIEMYRFVRNRVDTVLKYIGCDKIIKNNEVEELWLVTPYVELGSLHDYLNESTNIRPKWSQVLSVCLDIARGLSYLHEDGSYQTALHISGKPSIAHRDLKSRNILIKPDWKACIADLGLAVSFHGNRSLSDLHLQVGTQRYMAPEVLEGAINFSRDSFLGIDVYAMALILWEVFSQCVDFEGLANNTSDQIPIYMQPYELELGSQVTMENLQSWVVNENKRPQFPNQYSGFNDGQILWKTIIECWDRDAEARLSSSCVYQRLLSLNQKFTKFQMSMSVKADNCLIPQDSDPLI